MKIFNAEGQAIKHLSPVKYRKFKKDLHLMGVPKHSQIIVQIYYKFKDDLYADVWLLENNELNFYLSIQSY